MISTLFDYDVDDVDDVDTSIRAYTLCWSERQLGLIRYAGLNVNLHLPAVFVGYLNCLTPCPSEVRFDTLTAGVTIWLLY